MKNFILGVVCCVLLAASGNAIYDHLIVNTIISVGEMGGERVSVSPSAITWLVDEEIKFMILYQDGALVLVTGDSKILEVWR